MESIAYSPIESHPGEVDGSHKKQPRIGKWWQVRYQDADGIEQSDVFETAIHAEFRRDELSRHGVQCRIRRCRFDVLVFDNVSESLIVINRRMTRNQASQLAFEWTGTSGRCGVLVWPSGEELPKKFVLVGESSRLEGEVAA